MAQVTAPMEVIEGKSYYLHTVKKGETAYAISKLYECEINALLAANPGADSGIREGQTLHIPVEKSKARVTILAPDKDGFINHEVQKRETLFSIARLYSVDVNRLAEANPGSDTGIKKGQILKVPLTGAVQAPKELQPSSQSVKVHTVQAGETLYSISRQYNVPVDVIEQSNPGLTETLSVGQQIRVPVKALPLGTEPNEHSSGYGTIDFGPVKIDGPSIKASYQIALMLPFLTSASDTVGMTLKEKKLQSVAFQIYRGAMMASDTLQSMGLSADIYTYDLADDRNLAREIVKKEEMQAMDLIIGPAFRDPLQEVATWAAKSGAHVVCPVPQVNKVLLSSPNMSKAYASELTMWEGMGTFVGKKHQKDNVILLTTKDVEDLKRIQAFRSSYKAQTGDSLVEHESVNRSVSGLSKKLKPTGRNVVIVPTADKLILTTIFRELNSNNTIVYGTEDWEENNVIEPSSRNKYHIRYPKAHFTDYHDEHIQSWIESFRKRYRSEPDEYGFLGYSIMMYYGKGLMQYGRQFPNHFSDIPCPECAVSAFDFVRTGGESGFENRHFFIVGTEDFELIQVNK